MTIPPSEYHLVLTLNSTFCHPRCRLPHNCGCSILRHVTPKFEKKVFPWLVKLLSSTGSYPSTLYSIHSCWFFFLFRLRFTFAFLAFFVSFYFQDYSISLPPPFCFETFAKYILHRPNALHRNGTPNTIDLLYNSFSYCLGHLLHIFPIFFTLIILLNFSYL